MSISPGRSKSQLNLTQDGVYKNEQSPFTTGPVTNASGRTPLWVILGDEGPEAGGYSLKRNSEKSFLVLLDLLKVTVVLDSGVYYAQLLGGICIKDYAWFNHPKKERWKGLHTASLDESKKEFTS